MRLTDLSHSGVFVELIVVSELSNKHGVATYFINETVFIIDAPGPVTGQCVFEWFWFTDAFKWSALDNFDQKIDSF